MRLKNVKTMKKTAAVIAAAAMAAAVLAGCGSKEEAAPAEAAEATEATEAVEVSEEDAGEVTVIKVGNPGVYNLQGFIDEDGNLAGYEPDILNAIDELLPQYEFEYVITDFSSLFPALDAEKIDMATSNLRRTEDRDASYIHTTRAYGTSPYNIILLNDNEDIQNTDDLVGRTIGVTESSTQATILQEYIDRTGADIELYYTTDPVSDLQSGRIAAFISPGRYALSLNESYEDAQFKYVGDPIDTLADEGSVASDYNTYFWFRPGDEELRDAVSEAIETLYENGFLLEKSEEWYQDDYISLINKDIEEEFLK